MGDYASKLTKTAESVLDGEQFVAAMKCFPQGYVRRRIKASMGGVWVTSTLANERSVEHALDEEALPMELAIGLTPTRAFVFGVSSTTTKAKLPPVKVVPRETVLAVASAPGRTLHIHQTLLWLETQDGRVLALETAQRHQQNGEEIAAHLLQTARAMDVPSENTAGSE